VRGPRRGGLERIGESEASARGPRREGLGERVSGESEISAETTRVLLIRFFGLCLGYPFFRYPTVAPEPRVGVRGTLPEVLSRLCFSVAFVGLVLYS